MSRWRRIWVRRMLRSSGFKMTFPKENPVVNIPDDVLAQLMRGIMHRQIDSGMLCLSEHENLLEHLDPTQKNAARLVGYYAQWLDIGYGQHSRLKDLLARFSTELRANRSEEHTSELQSRLQLVCRL